MKTILSTLIISKKTFFTILFIVSFISYSEAQVSENSKVEDVKKTQSKESSTFPIYINTGQKELDDKRYLEAKQAWILANPEEYQKILNRNPIEVSKIEFEKMPTKKQNEIKNHPEKYILK
jgi:hypothetical protein